MKSLLSSEVIFPENIERIFEGEYGILEESIRRSSKLLVFIDSTQCGECQISKLPRFEPIIEIADSIGDFKVVFLVSPKKSEINKIRRFIELTYMPYPIYVDIDNAFKSLNPSIPDDARFHCMYIGEDGRPLIVGDPTTSMHINSYYKKRFRQKKSK